MTFFNKQNTHFRQLFYKNGIAEAIFNDVGADTETCIQKGCKILMMLVLQLLNDKKNKNKGSRKK